MRKEKGKAVGLLDKIHREDRREREVTDKVSVKAGLLPWRTPPIPTSPKKKKKAGYAEEMSKCFLECVSSLLSLQVTEQWKWKRLQKIGVC